MQAVKLFRRLVILISLIVVIGCMVLLLNFTASNPTGRRYSSAPVVTRGNTQAIGLSGEQILSADLRAPRNDEPEQRQCVCNSTGSLNTGDCRVCIAYSPAIANYRRPDFITDTYIAESKNRQNLLYTYADLAEQIGDYVLAAQTLNRPLWVYVRIDTVVDPTFYGLVGRTGGGIVPYFAPAGYVDPVDEMARRGLIGGGVIFIAMVLWGRLAVGMRRVRTPIPARTPAPKRPSGTLNDAEVFARETKERLQRRIDKEDSRLT